MFCTNNTINTRHIKQITSIAIPPSRRTPERAAVEDLIFQRRLYPAIRATAAAAPKMTIPVVRAPPQIKGSANLIIV